MAAIMPLARPALLALLVLLAACGGGRDAPYVGWSDPVRLGNGKVELVAVPQVARVLDFGPVNGGNLLWLDPRTAGGVQGDGLNYRTFGGGKLWVAPQAGWKALWGMWPPCPLLDGGACTVEARDGRSVRLRGADGSRHGVRFDRDIALAEDRPRADLTYRLVATGTPAPWAAWSVVQLRPGGRLLVPLAGDEAVRWEKPEHERGWTLEDGCWSARQDAVRGKLFLDGGAGWLAYVVGRTAFVLVADPEQRDPRPAGEARFEVFFGADFVELEQVGSLRALKPGETAVLRETWWALPLPEGADQLPTRQLRDLIVAGIGGV